MAAPTQFERFVLPTAPLSDGTVLLEASAGTGKTYTITGILLRMVLEDVVEHIEQALVVTFTVAAADELKNRLRAALQQARDVCRGKQSADPFFQGLAHYGKQGAKKLQQALEQFDQASVMTIHGFCKRLLDEAAFESHAPFDLDFAVDEAPLWHAAAADALRFARDPDSPILGAVLHAAKIAPDSLVPLYRNWQRYPDVVLDPADPQPRVHLDNLRAAMHRAASLWDDELAECCIGLRWRSSKAPFTGDPRGYYAEQAALLRQQPELSVAFLSRFGRSQLKTLLYQRPPPPLDHTFFSICDEVHALAEAARQHLVSSLLRRMHLCLAAHKRERAIMTFDDLLQRTHAALCDRDRRSDLLRSLQQRYSVALIDEFQDTDERQYGILSTCFANRPLFLVGDPKQSIYGFRGADLRTYLDAADDAIHRGTLTVNFRSSPQLVAAVGHLFQRGQAFVEPNIRMRQVRADADESKLQITGDDGAALRFRLLPAQTDDKGKPKAWSVEAARQRIADDVCEEIHRLLRSGASIDRHDLLPRDIAVLTRRNVEAVLIQTTLRAAGIVSVIGKAGDVFDTEELPELERLLIAIVRPNDLLRARAAMTTRLWGLDAAELAALEADEAGLDEQLGHLERWRQLWLRAGFVVMKEQMLADLNADARLLAQCDGERRLTNLQQLCEMLHQAEHEHRLSPEGLLHWLRHERSHKEEIDYQRRELRLESDEDAVQILTMHGSKGLQYEIVFCPFLWEGRVAPSRNTVIERAANDDEQQHREHAQRIRFDARHAAEDRRRRFVFEVQREDPGWLQAEADRLAEDVRLCYVALTRARRRCYVHWGAIGSSAGSFCRSALGWLLQPAPVDQKQPDWPITWAEAYKSHMAQLADELQAVVDRSHGTMQIDAIDEHGLPLAAPDGPADEGRAGPRTCRGRQMPGRQPLVMHSFSSLIVNSEPGSTAHDVRDPGTEPAAVGTGIFGFARGAEAGSCLHDVLEHVDLAALDSDALRHRVLTTLQQHGLAEPKAHPGRIDAPAVVQQTLHELAAARAHPDGPSIAMICGGVRLAEWRFTIPIAAPDLQALADRFARADCPVAAGYAERLRGLRQHYLAGFLTGFLDLVSEHDGRYWILDWKSNHLGNSVEDYDQPALLQAMHEHDYVLQYHLYVLALHRHLRARLPGYDYDRHLAGVCYPFLRGAVAGTTNGMFYARPPRALIAAMDEWAQQPSQGGSR